MDTDKIYAESIANQYAPKEESKVVALKKLDKKAKHRSVVFAWTWGIISALILGGGMSLIMTGQGYGSGVVGIVIGVVGLICCLLTYPLYKKIRKADMQKYANDIMLLAKEISDEE